MLVNLHVKNLALIDEIEVEFSKGLNILTGETGAGKSIILGSMQLALGGKMSREMIREHASYALVELLFQVEDPQAEDRLRKLDIFPEEGQVLISRKILEGRSIGKINGETCTVGQMKAAASCLLDIHGQNEHQSLLYRDRQLGILDEYGGADLKEAKQTVSQAYGSYRKVKKQLEESSMDEKQRLKEISFLEFEVDEIEKSQLLPHEDEELEKQYRKLSNSRRIAEGLQQIHALTGYDSDQGAGESVGRGLKELQDIADYDESLASMEQSLTDIDALLNDFNREVSAYLDDFQFEDEQLFEIEQRLDLLNNLKAKYGSTVEQVLEYAAQQQVQLEKLLSYGENIQKLKEQLACAEEELAKASHKLSKIRKTYSKKLEQQISESLKDLNFAAVDFEIAFLKNTGYSANGWDEVEYMISTNPGEPKKSLGKVVSGGELSRIMLAIKAILADKDEVETLIFDEIDTGISGRTAQKVSEKMALIGERRQVLCITHLPQIAAMADAHYEISKSVNDSETVTQIRRLDEQDSIRELARLLGGAAITDTVRKSAEEMKDLAQQQKNTRLK